ncbi:MAG: hypothetical protein J6N18_06445, partial [Kiritimatiellae bacterium]|nr:hypothetical protein [Kiritimatiellia bacterium]
MIILPAIDLKGGKCVRLRQGREDDVTVYGDDPAAQAADWQSQGGRELHVVDLDGAFAGTPKHAEVIGEIIKAFGGPVEVGGGIRNLEALAAVLDAGAARAIIGSAALDDPEFLVSGKTKRDHRAFTLPEQDIFYSYPALSEIAGVLGDYRAFDDNIRM